MLVEPVLHARERGGRGSKAPSRRMRGDALLPLQCRICPCPSHSRRDSFRAVYAPCDRALQHALSCAPAGPTFIRSMIARYFTRRLGSASLLKNTHRQQQTIFSVLGSPVADAPVRGPAAAPPRLGRGAASEKVRRPRPSPTAAAGLTSASSPAGSPAGESRQKNSKKDATPITTMAAAARGSARGPGSPCACGGR